MELSTILSESLSDKAHVTLDKSDAFIFGFSKLDVMFGRATLDAVRLPYKTFAKPGCASTGRRSSPSILLRGA